jgi:hypothetical protein
MTLDGWVSVRNETGMDVCAGSVDLVAGEVQLLAEGGSSPRVFTANSQIAQFGNADEAQPEGAAISGLSVFSRISLGSNLAIAANTSIGRFPLFQHLKLAVEQRNVFENEATAQTLGRGGFMLAPRGLEVRLVSRNSSKELFPSGTVTVYSQEGGIPQVVGQDRIPITPVGADFSVTQGRSNVLQGTRRVIDRHDEADPDARNRRKLITQVEVVLTNRSAEEVPAFVREGVEHYRSGQWTVTESSHRHQRLAEDLMEFRVSVPAKGSVKVTYTVETR